VSGSSLGFRRGIDVRGERWTVTAVGLGRWSTFFSIALGRRALHAVIGIAFIRRHCLRGCRSARPARRGAQMNRLCPVLSPSARNNNAAKKHVWPSAAAAPAAAAGYVSGVSVVVTLPAWLQSAADCSKTVVPLARSRTTVWRRAQTLTRGENEQ